MNPAPYSSSFGRYLRAIRIQKGIDLESVAREIRVGVSQLALIESEDHEHLPDEIYVKGILRAYARCIGVDGDDIVDRYLLNRSDFEEGAESRRGRRRNIRTPLWLLPVGGIILVIAAGVYEARKHYPPAVQSRPVKSSQLPDDSPPAIVRQQGPLMLKIDAVEKTWIKVNIDGEEPLNYLLNPGDHIELEGRSRISLVIGNAGGLKMRLNDKPVALPGKSGDVVKIELPQSSSGRH